MQQLPKWAWMSLVICVLGVFVLFRWEMRREPLNSDDMTLFQLAARAAAGNHWLFQSDPSPHFNHQALRIGTLPFALPAIGLFGPTAIAYYLVPLVFSLCGFALTWFIMHREIHPGAAFVFALVLLLLPFEVVHSSLFLVDVPTAVMTLLCLVLVVILSRPPGVSSLSIAGRGSLIGLVAFEGYLLRENAPILLAPAFVFFLFSQQTRRVVVWAGVALALGICLEQLLYLAKGFDWGFRLLVNARAHEGYASFLPVYTWGEFAGRQFVHLWRFFKGWPDGAFAVTFYVTALVAHGGMFLWSRSLLLRALALTGLATWFSVAFAIYGRVDGGVRALALSNFRYFQFFSYSAIVSLCWLTYQLYRTTYGWLLVSRLQPRRSQQVFARTALVGLGCVVLGVVGMSARLTTTYVPARLLNPDGKLQTILRTIDRLRGNQTDEPLHLYTLPGSYRVVSLFRGPWSHPPVVWQPRKLEKLVELLKRQIPPLVLRDERQEEWRGRMRDPKYREAIGVLQRVLWEQYTPLKTQGRWRLYQATAQPVRMKLLPNGDFHDVDRAAGTIPFWQLTLPIDELTHSPENYLVLPMRDRPFYLYSGNPSGFSRPPADPAPYRFRPRHSYTFRINVRLAENVTASVFIIQYDATQRIADKHVRLESGENYVTVTPEAAAHSYRVALRFATQPSPAVTFAELVEVSVREFLES